MFSLPDMEAQILLQAAAECLALLQCIKVCISYKYVCRDRKRLFIIIVVLFLVVVVVVIIVVYLGRLKDYILHVICVCKS